jgi:hypothetical protein
MKTALILFSAIAVTCALAMPAAAQYPNQGEVNYFNAFLNGHPQVAAELYRNPSLVDSKLYLDEHPELHSFLADHDQLRRAIQTHPGAFMYSGGRYSYGWGRGGWNPAWNNENYVNQEQWERLHNYGYWDPSNHQWHDREWWEHNRADWVREHHPRWAAAAAEHRQDYRQRQEHHDNGKHDGHGHDHDSH